MKEWNGDWALWTIAVAVVFFLALFYIIWYAWWRAKKDAILEQKRKKETKDMITQAVKDALKPKGKDSGTTKID